jgi:outer membrane lipoprotein LolB
MSAPCREPAHAWRRAALPFLALVVAGGCASLAPVEPAPQVYTGRFSASIERGSEREAISGRFTLAASAQRITLDLASPLGNTLARVASDAGGATLTSPRADGTLATWQGDSADALAESVLGYRLPVTGLADWIAGRATPGRPAGVSPERGPAQRIEQDGWVIDIDERFEPGGAPRRLSLQRAATGAQAPALRLRLVLDDAGAALGPSERARP